jgi:hypothetical protein
MITPWWRLRQLSVGPSIQVLPILAFWSNRHGINVSRPSKTCPWDCWCRGPETWHLVGAGAPRGTAGPSPGQVWPAVASCARPWPGCGRLWPAVGGRGAAEPGCGAAGPGQVRPALHNCFGAPLYGSFVYCYSHICVPSSKNTNKARGTSLVLKMCMMFVISSSHSWDNYGRIFVVGTVNKLPHTWSFARPWAKSKLGLGGSGVAWCYHLASTCAQTPCSSCYFKKVGRGEA